MSSATAESRLVVHPGHSQPQAGIARECVRRLGSDPVAGISEVGQGERLVRQEADLVFRVGSQPQRAELVGQTAVHMKAEAGAVKRLLVVGHAGIRHEGGVVIQPARRIVDGRVLQSRFGDPQESGIFRRIADGMGLFQNVE